MPDATVDRPLSPGALWRCQVAWVLLLLSVLNWREGSSVFALSPVQEQLGTILATAIAFVLVVQANPALLVARVSSQLLAGLLVVASVVPGMLAMAPANSLLLSARFGLVVLTLWLLSPIVVADPVATLRTYLWSHAAITLCLLAGGVLAPGTAFLPGTHRLSGILPPMHPSQVGTIAAVAVGLGLLALMTEVISRRLGLATIVIATIVLTQSRSRTAVLATLVGLLVALSSLVLQSRRARRLLAVLVCVAAVTWIAAAPLFISWFARGQTHAQIGGFSGRRAVWIAMLEERPAGLNHWLGIGLGDKRYKGDPIDSGWVAAYWQQGLFGFAVTALLVVVIAWQAVRNRDALLRAGALYITVLVAVSASTESGISDMSIYFLSLMLAGLIAAARPSMTQRNRNADRRRAQPLSLGLSEW